VRQTGIIWHVVERIHPWVDVLDQQWKWKSREQAQRS
jgi:hypothetical protein